MNLGNFLADEMARMEIYQVFADCYRPPTSDLATKLGRLDQRIQQICRDASRHVRIMKQALKETDDLSPLEIDFSKLFVGPFELLAPPYGSIYLEGIRQVMGDSTMEARRLYRELGLDISKEVSDPPDHIAVELEFMHFLVFKEIEALWAGAYTVAEDYVRKQMSFLDSHLGAWVSEFSDLVTKNSETVFYKCLGVLTVRFLEKETAETVFMNLRQVHRFANGVSQRQDPVLLPHPNVILLPEITGRRIFSEA